MLAYRRSLMLLPCLISALAMLACLGSPGTPPTATVAAAPTATVPAATAVPTAAGSSSDDARAALLRALQASQTAGPYRVVSSITSGTSTIAMHGEVILPDRFHLFSSNAGAPEREYIIIGSATYAKVGDQWSQVQIDLSDLVDNFINSLNPENISDVRLVGPEDANGTPALAYTFIYTNTIGGVQITNSDETWVGLDNGLPVKQVVDGELNGTAYHTEQAVEYDPSITIEAPATP